MKKEQKIEEMQLFSSIEEYLIEQICAILHKENIPFIKKTDGSGSYINISMGNAFQEKRIFVNKTDYDKALNLIEPFIIQEENKELDSDFREEIKKYALIKKMLVVFVLGLTILAIILIICSDIFHN